MTDQAVEALFWADRPEVVALAEAIGLGSRCGLPHATHHSPTYSVHLVAALAAAGYAIVPAAPALDVERLARALAVGIAATRGLWAPGIEYDRMAAAIAAAYEEQP